LHSADNIVPLPKLVHELVNADYSQTSEVDKTKTVREWLQTQSYEVQREYAIKTLQRLGILKP
jgi:hypothetical protein